MRNRGEGSGTRKAEGAEFWRQDGYQLWIPPLVSAHNTHTRGEMRPPGLGASEHRERALLFLSSLSPAPLRTRCQSPVTLAIVCAPLVALLLLSSSLSLLCTLLMAVILSDFLLIYSP